MAKKIGFHLVLRGEDRVLKFQTVDADGQPRPLGAPGEIQMDFINEDGTVLEKKLTTSGVAIISDDRGEFSVSLDDTETTALKLVDREDLCAEITIGSNTRKVRFAKSLSVEDC